MRNLLDEEAERLGIPDTDMLVATLRPALGQITAATAIDVARVILSAASAMPRDPMAYIARACEQPADLRRLTADVLDITEAVA